MVTIRKLAQLAGVSHVTVWCALHNQPGVSAEARARILALAEEQHYHPNRLVEGYLSGRTHLIGYISHHFSSSFPARLCEGLIHAASRDRAHILSLNMALGQPLQPQLSPLISQLIEQRVEGIIICCGNTTVSIKSVLEMWSHDIVPVLIDDTRSEKPLDHIDPDERQLAQCAVEYLLHLGHRRIAYCGLDWPHIRSREVCRELKKRGLSLEYCIGDTGKSARRPQWSADTLTGLSPEAFPPTAVICFEDRIAFHLLTCVQQHGFHVPGDLSILGCSNASDGEVLTPPLTTIEQHPEEFGRRAYELIKRRHEAGEAPGERLPETILVRPQLVIRESCSPPNPRRTSTIFPTREVLPVTPNMQRRPHKSPHK